MHIYSADDKVEYLWMTHNLRVSDREYYQWKKQAATG